MTDQNQDTTHAHQSGLHAKRSASLTSKRSNATSIYLFSIFGLLTLFGVSSALVAASSNEDNAMNNASTNQTNPSRTTVELRKEQRSTSSDVDERHDGRGSATSESQDTGSAANFSETSVTVNGESIPVPENGSTRRTIVNESDDGNTQVDISVEHHSSGTDSSQDSGRRTERTRLNISTDSSTSTSTRSSNKTIITNSE